MEGLNPTLSLCLELRQSVEAGESLRLGLARFLRGRTDLFAEECRRWLERRDRGGDHQVILRRLKSPYRRALLEILERGLQGHPVEAALREIQQEIERACMEEIDRRLALLPFQMLIPLLLFLFPATMILILAPLMDLLAQSFAQ